MNARRGVSRTDVAAVVMLACVGVALVMPTLAGARQAVRGQVSLANILTINAANGRYMADFAGKPPLTLTYSPRYSPAIVQAKPHGDGYCTWSFGGKNNSAWWVNGGWSSAFDIEAADRPLNPYVYSGVIYAPPSPQRLPANDPTRTSLEIPVFRDPGDRVSHQRNWPYPNTSMNPPVNNTAYDDVGVSYDWNATWMDQPEFGIFSMAARMRMGTALIATQQRLSPSKFVWISDDLPSLQLYTASAGQSGYINTYGDRNMGVLGFLDGSAGYSRIFTPAEMGDARFNNAKHQFWFDPAPVPRKASGRTNAVTTEPGVNEAAAR